MIPQPIRTGLTLSAAGADHAALNKRARAMQIERFFTIQTPEVLKILGATNSKSTEYPFPQDTPFCSIESGRTPSFRKGLQQDFCLARPAIHQYPHRGPVFQPAQPLPPRRLFFSIDLSQVVSNSRFREKPAPNLVVKSVFCYSLTFPASMFLAV